jgi:hypothetical protein
MNVCRRAHGIWRTLERDVQDVHVDAIRGALEAARQSAGKRASDWCHRKGTALRRNAARERLLVGLGHRHVEEDRHLLVLALILRRLVVLRVRATAARQTVSWQRNGR